MGRVLTRGGALGALAVLEIIEVRVQRRCYRLDERGKKVDKLQPFKQPIHKRQLSPSHHASLCDHYAQSGARVVWFVPRQWTKIIQAERASLLGLSDGVTADPDDPYSKGSLKGDVTVAYVDEYDRLNLLLSDDTFQASRVDLAVLPTGWQHLVAVLHWLEQ